MMFQSQAEINHLRDRYAPLRGEAWYRREPIPGSKVGKKVLDVFFLEETLPELLDLLLGDEGEGGVGLAAKQVNGRGRRGNTDTGSGRIRSGDVLAAQRRAFGEIFCVRVSRERVRVEAAIGG